MWRGCGIGLGIVVVFQLLFNRGVPEVLDFIICSARETRCYLRPPVIFEHFENKKYNQKKKEKRKTHLARRVPNARLCMDA